MNKKELVKVVAAKSGLTQKQASAAVESVLSSVIESVKKGENVTLLGFGTFIVKDRRARQGFNPLTKSHMHIPSRRVVKFSAGNKMNL